MVQLLAPSALAMRLQVEIFSLRLEFVAQCVLFCLGLYDPSVLSFSLMGLWPTINVLAGRVVDGFFIRGVLPVFF